MVEDGRDRGRAWGRHSLHIFSYSFVSAALILMGLLFSAFAIFDKDSLIGQIWLAGPTTIAVGLVLCGKVIIDCRPIADADDLTEEDNYAFPDPVNGLPPYDPQFEAKLESLDLEYAKQKEESQVILPQAQTSDSASLASDVWSPRVLLPHEVLGESGLCLSNSASTGRKTERKASSSLRLCPHKAREPRRGGSARRTSSSVMYQGETFVLNDMQYLI